MNAWLRWKPANEGQDVRVIAGTAGGRRLVTPTGLGTRPTSDRVKEALFSALGSMRGGLQDAVVLDLYAGSGSLAVEALSRGAAQAVLVENDAAALQAIRQNLETAGVSDRATIVRADAAKYCQAPERFGAVHAFDLVLLDPPYEEPQEGLFQRLVDLRAAGALSPEACVAIERDRRADDPDPPGWLARERVRTYGDTMVRYFRCQEDRR